MAKSKKPGKDQVVPILANVPTMAQGNISDETARQAWFRRFWPLLLSAGLSLVWIGICIWWFATSGKVIAQMPVNETGGLMAGASLPLILVWLVALVYLRTDPLRDHRTALAHGLDKLLAPLETAQRRVNSIVAELYKEIDHVEAAGDIATERIDNLENRFQVQISNLFDVTTDAEARAVKIQEILSTEREVFISRVTEVTELITELETTFKQIKFDSETLVNATRKNSEEVSDEITSQNKALEERSRLIDEQLEKMAGELDKISGEIFQNCELSENKLGSISKALSEKQTALTETLTGLADNTDQICVKMDKQSGIIAQLSGKTAEDSEKISITLLEQSTNLSSVAAGALDLTTKSGQAFQTQADAMAKKLDEATEKSKTLLSDASDSFKSSATGIVLSSQTLSENLINHMGRATDDLDAKSETLEHTIAARVDMIEEALEKQSEIIRTKLTEQSEKASGIITNHGGEFMGNMDQQFAGLMEKMGDQTDQLQQFAGDTMGKLEETVSSIESQAMRVDESVKLTTESLDENTGKMNDHYASFEQLTEKFRSRIDQSEVQLKSQHDELVKSLSDVAEYLDDSLQKLKNQTGSLGEHAQEIISSIVEQSEQLSGHIDDIRDRTENTIHNIQEMGETVSHHFSATDEQAASLSENWLKTASLVENQCSDTLSRLDDLTNKLMELEKENTQAAAEAENNVTKVAGQMEHASESIFLASASAIEAADETNRVIDEHSEKFQQLINALRLSNKSILIDAEAIEQKNRDKSGNHFSNLASKMIEQLQSLSIDINRYFESDVPDKIWQAYVNGDKNTFVRRLKKVTNKKHSAAIREKYKSDPEFRKHALEYIQIFEELMSQSMISDSYSTFSVALISSETGKVYLALAQAMNRFSS